MNDGDRSLLRDIHQSTGWDFNARAGVIRDAVTRLARTGYCAIAADGMVTLTAAGRVAAAGLDATLRTGRINVDGGRWPR